jgi:hypothetical protein
VGVSVPVCPVFLVVSLGFWDVSRALLRDSRDCCFPLSRILCRLHNTTLLSHGGGVYFCFPVCYVGSIQLMISLSELNMDEKTLVVRCVVSVCERLNV